MSTDPTVARLAAGAFAATRWTLVLRARGDSTEGRLALSDLCAAYYGPVVAFLRRSEASEDAARETAHAFFARLLERGGFAGPDPERGRFRNYLLGALRYFLRNRHDLAIRAKRGGGAQHASLDYETEEARALQVADHATAQDAAAFDREWALALMNRVVAALEAEYAGERAALFAALQPWLMGEGATAHAETAARLGLGEGAVKVAVHRLRQRFRAMLKAEIAQTLADPAELNDELRHLCAALGSEG
jgi:DNA-directed RNA polymerase specialized sigma24 family protein